MKDFTEVDASHFNLSLSEFFTQFNITASTGVEPTISMLAAAQQLRQKNETALVVIQDRQVLGVLTEKDFLRALAEQVALSEVNVADYMTVQPKLLPMSLSVGECLDFVRKFEFRHVLIWDEDKCECTLLSIRDLLDFVVRFFVDEIKKHGLVRPDDSPLTIQKEDFNLHDDTGTQKRLNAEIFLNPLSRLVRDTPLKLDVLSSCGEVLAEMVAKRSDICVIVEYETKVVGVVSERDFLKYIADHDGSGLESLMSKNVAQFMTASPHCFFGRHLIAQAINNMHTFGYRQVIVVDEDGVPLGIVSLVQILSFIAHFLADE